MKYTLEFTEEISAFIRSYDEEGYIKRKFEFKSKKELKNSINMSKFKSNN